MKAVGSSLNGLGEGVEWKGDGWGRQQMPREWREVEVRETETVMGGLWEEGLGKPGRGTGAGGK